MKKALSVFLSLLMVITSISVVFTLPASAAVTSYVINENFDSMAAGNLDARREFEGADGWLRVGANAASANIVDLSVSSVDYNNCTAASGSNILTINSWSNAGYVFAVEPNTTYTLTFKWYTVADTREGNYARPQVSVNDVSALTGNIAGAHRGAVTDANSGSSSAVTTKTESWTCGTTSPAWKEIALSFTTAATSTKYLVSFTHENNDNSGVTAAQKALYIDDFAISYVAKPTVKAETYGAATSNGGVAWIETDISGDINENAEITYKAMPYDNALFDGWYVNGVKVSAETTLTRAWAVSEKIVAKFEALSENLFPDVENRTTYNTNGAKFTGDAKYTWVSGRAVTHTLIDKNLLTAGSCYGFTGTLTNAYAYSGKLSFTPASAGGHRSYQIVKVKPNTAYTLSFWYYQDTTVLFSGTNSNAQIGSINLDLATNPYTAETNEPADSKIIRITSGGNNTFTDFTNDESVEVQKRDLGAVWSNTAVTGQWAKATATFTSDEKGWVVVPFGGGNAVYLDHFTLCEAPKATTPTVTVSDNGMNAGFIQSVTDVYYEGDTFTATVVGYDNGTFLGWYVNEEKVSESLTYVFTYDSEATYVAKFDAQYPNIFEDGSFEGYTSTPSKLPTSGQSASSLGMFVWGVWNATTQTPTAKGWVGTQYGRGYVASSTAVNEIAAGAAPYAGNNVAVGYTGSHAIAKVVPVEQNKTYKLVYYTYSLSAAALASGKNHVVGVDMSDGTVANDGMTFLTNGTDGQTALTTTYTNFDNQTLNTWVRQEATFNSGDYTNVLVQFGVGASQGLMIDHISVFEVPQAFEPTITIDDGGKNAGIVYDVTEVYKDGDEFSATAKAYDNGTFIGWYVGDVLASENETATLTYDSTKTYTAKFSALKANIWPEDPEPSSTTPLYKGTGHTTPKEIGANDWTGQSWATIYNVDNDYIATLGSGLKAYAGDTAYYFGSHNGHNAYKVVRGLKTNTDYTLTYWVYDNGISSNKNTLGQVVDVATTNPTLNDNEASSTVNYGITGIATGATHIEVADMCVNIGTAATTYPQVRPTQSTVSKNPVQNAWYRVERTFNTGANTDFLINFGNHEVEIVMYDHVSLYETPVQTTPTVTVDDNGMNAGRVYGVTKVWTEGETFTATTMAYENGTFLGFYVGDEKVADEKVTANADGSYTATFTYDEDAVYTAKYSAEQKNIFPDHEDRTTFNKVGDKFVGTAAYHWVSGATVNHTVIDKNILTAVTTYGYGNSLINNDKVYAGDTSFTGSTTGGHAVYQIVKVEPNTKYELTYYYYQDSVIHKTSGIYSINLDIAQNIYADVYTNESAEDLILHTSTAGYPMAFTSEAGVHQVLLASTNEGSFSEVGAWTKMTRTFTSDELGWVLIPFATDVAGTYYVDHVSLVKIPAPMLVTAGNTGGNIIVDGAVVDSYEFAVGSNATFTAQPFPGNTFLGWYTDPSLTGEPVSQEETLTITATEETVYYAKFQDGNAFEGDSSFEDVDTGSIEERYEELGWYTETVSGYGSDAWANISVVGATNGITPYSGDKMIEVNHHSNGGWFKNVAVEPNTTYTFSFKYAFMHNKDQLGNDLETKFCGIVVSSRDFVGYSESVNGHRIIDSSIGNNSTDSNIPVEDGVWYTYSITFNSGTLNSINMTAHYASSKLYIDDMTLVKCETPTITVETIAPFGQETTEVGGYAYAYVDPTNLEQATYYAIANDGNKFLGWYEGETLFSAESEIHVGGGFPDLTAKFMDMGFDSALTGFTNLYSQATNGFDGSFDSLKHGWLIGGGDAYEPTYDGDNDNGWTYAFDGDSKNNPGFGSVWTYSNRNGYGGIKVVDDVAHSGKQSLLVREGVKGSVVLNKLTGLQTNTDYVVSFYYYINGMTGTNFIDEVAVTATDWLAASDIGNMGKYRDTAISYIDLEEEDNKFGEWGKMSISFNTGELTEVVLHILYTGGDYENCVKRVTNLYLDDFDLKLQDHYETAANTAFNTSVERGGVAIRLPDAEGAVTQALRFKARIAKDSFEAMALGSDYKVVEYGSIAMNASYIDGATNVEKANSLTFELDENGNKIPYTNAGKSANIGVSYSAAKGTNKVFGYKPGERDLIFTAALTGIGKNMTGDNLAKAYKTEFIVRTYAILELTDGTKVVVYDTVDESDTFCASIYAVAQLAVADPEVSQTDKDYIQQQIIDICEATPEEGVASSYSVTYNGAGLANETPIDNFFVDDIITINGDKGDHTNSRPTYYANDKTIRAYAGNTLTLTAKDGYYISSVVINTLEDYPYGNATTSTGVAETVDNTTTITGINSAEFVLTTPAATRITSITVNYKNGEAPDPIYPETPEEPEEPVDPNTTEVNASDLGLENATKLSETSADLGTVVLSGAKGTNESGNVPTYYSSDSTIRTYAGNTLTFTAETAAAYNLRSVSTAKNIKSIIITYKSANEEEADPHATVSVGTIDTDGAVATISDINAREITITFAAKARIIAIKIITEDITPCETHTYTDNCDVECNVCYAVRDDAPHAFASDCDTTCECGATREALADHTADPCASVCELCGEAVVPTHKFAGDCDTTCECGETKEATADHTYVDGACSVCGAIEPVSCSHEYDNGCDAECNICFAIREDLTHTFESDCDTKCEYCDETREALADHTYEFVCSTECTACGATREADHVYNEGFCECGKAQPTEVTATLSIADYATANSWADGTKYADIIVVKGDLDKNIITATAIGGGNTGKYYTNGNNWRIYQGESGKVTLTAAAGYTIVSVKFTYTNSNGGVLTYNSANVASGDVTAINGATATFIVGNTGTASNGQARITDIEVVYDIVPECAEGEHVYTNDCDADCDVCGTVRDEIPHAYASDCDTTCDCGLVREALADHTTDDACKTACDLCGEAVTPTHTADEVLCDTTCSNCGATVEATEEHSFDDGCDTECNNCGATREATHADDVLCDTTCSNCGAEVEATADHVYDDENDAICNNCGFERVLESQCDHAADAQLCDTTCSVCGADVEATVDHTWTNACDTTCDVCETVREQAHVDTILCDTVCSTCGAEVEATADHVYTDNCDADCNNCGATRTVTHDDAVLCDTTCSNCGATVEATAEHNYVDGVCDACGAEKPTSTTTTINAETAGIAASANVGTHQVDEVITIIGEQGTHSNSQPVYNSSSQAFRCYQGNLFTIQVADGYIIESIIITTDASYKMSNATISSGTMTGETTTTATITGINASEFIINCSTNRVYIKTITVVYKVPCTHEYDDDCDANCNLCDEAREVTHADDVLCDEICSNCGAAVEATADHVYDDENDAICNNCGFERVLESQCDHAADAQLCDTTCSVCGAEVEPTADHTWTNACDTNCDVCDTAREQAHVDTILCDTVCSTCGAEVEATAEHNYVDGACDACGAEEVSGPVATFTLGADGSATHKDGTSNKTSYTETVGDYTLNLTGGTNMYPSSIDAMGNGAIKLGSSSKTGGFSFTVGEDVTKVVIYVAGYKAKTVSVNINGTTYDVTATSNTGSYQAIEIDTTTEKTVTLITATNYRAMVNTIEFWA